VSSTDCTSVCMRAYVYVCMCSHVLAMVVMGVLTLVRLWAGGHSNAKAEQFTKQPLQVATHAIAMSLTQSGALPPDFTDRMWQAIDQECTLSEWCAQTQQQAHRHRQQHAHTRIHRQ
jgi:hypothetical protein